MLWSFVLMNKNKSANIVFFITFIFLLTFILTVLQPYLYKISIELSKHPHFHKTVDSDLINGGKSNAKWLNKDNNVWQCQFGQVLVDYPYCQYQVYLGNGQDKGIDLSVYDELQLTIDYTGDVKALTVYMRNYNQQYSQGKTDYNSTKYMRVEIDTVDFKNTVKVDLTEFKVSDWWLDTYNLPRHLRLESFNNVVLFGVQIEPNRPKQLNKQAEQNTKHKLTIKNVQFNGQSVSKEQFYFYIILFWGLVIVILIVFQFLKMFKTIKKGQQSLETLKDNNKELFEEKQIFEQLSKQDKLTQLPNRAGIEAYINQHQTQSSATSFVVGLIDVDHFKQLNDNYGHDGGDAVLASMGKLLSEQVRKQDCAGRWGGEEFVIIWSNLSTEDAKKCAEKIRQTVSQHSFTVLNNNASTNVRITVSIGISPAQNHQQIINAITRADMALYKAKEDGRNRVEFKANI